MTWEEWHVVTFYFIFFVFANRLVVYKSMGGIDFVLLLASLEN